MVCSFSTKRYRFDEGRRGACSDSRQESIPGSEMLNGGVWPARTVARIQQMATKIGYRDDMNFSPVLF
jgi:hypothetical protein